MALATVSPSMLLAAGFAAVLLAGCSTPRPTELPLTIEAAPMLNRDDQGRALSVVLRIYQLRDATRFASAPFAALLRRDDEALGAELVSRDEQVVAPGAPSQTLRVALDHQTRYIGVVALFRQPDRRHWRQLVAVDPAQSIALRLEECGIRVSAGRAVALDGVRANGVPFECARGPR